MSSEFSDQIKFPLMRSSVAWKRKVYKALTIQWPHFMDWNTETQRAALSSFFGLPSLLFCFVCFRFSVVLSYKRLLLSWLKVCHSVFGIIWEGFICQKAENKGMGGELKKKAEPGVIRRRVGSWSQAGLSPVLCLPFPILCLHFFREVGWVIKILFDGCHL